MHIFLALAIAMGIILFLLRRHLPIGAAIICGGLFLWLVRAPEAKYLYQAALIAAQQQRTYDLLFALYFVMCLEFMLRFSGALSGMVEALGSIFPSKKFTFALMPAFLGLLPSVGGARFSCPIVAEASAGTKLNSEHKATINFWFRHIFEYSNPINPGMMMACAIAGIPIGYFITHLGYMTIFSFALGWFVLLSALPLPATAHTQKINRTSLLDVVLCLAPVLVNFFLVVFFSLSAAVSMGLVVILMLVVLALIGRPIPLRRMLVESIDPGTLLNVIAILYFIELLTVTKTLPAIVAAFNSLPLPQEVIVASISFIIGILTGLSQGHVAIMLPIVVVMAPHDFTVVALAMVSGIAGQMITPTHVCLMVTLDYFQANYFRVVRPLILMEIALVSIFCCLSFLF